MYDEIKSIIPLAGGMIFAFVGQALAEDWFSGTAANDVLTAETALWDAQPAEGVSVSGTKLQIDLPTNTVFGILRIIEDGRPRI